MASCDPKVLAAEAQCFVDCIPPGMQLAVTNYLLAQILNMQNPMAPTDPKAILALATAPGSNFMLLDGMQEAVQTYLTCAILTASGG